MDAVAYWLAKLVYQFVFSVVAAPFYMALAGLFWIVRTMGQPPRWLGILGLAVIVGTQWLIYRLATKAALRRVAGGPFVDSMYDAAREVRMELALLPVVGPWFEPRRPR